MGLGVIRILAQGLTDVIDGEVVPANLMRDQAEQMERIDLTWIHLQDLAIQLFRSAQVAGLMILHGQGERLGQIHVHHSVTGYSMSV